MAFGERKINKKRHCNLVLVARTPNYITVDLSDDKRKQFIRILQ